MWHEKPISILAAWGVFVTLTTNKSREIKKTRGKRTSPIVCIFTVFALFICNNEKQAGLFSQQKKGKKSLNAKHYLIHAFIEFLTGERAFGNNRTKFVVSGFSGSLFAWKCGPMTLCAAPLVIWHHWLAHDLIILMLHADIKDPASVATEVKVDAAASTYAAPTIRIKF